VKAIGLLETIENRRGLYIDKRETDTSSLMEQQNILDITYDEK